MSHFTVCDSAGEDFVCSGGGRPALIAADGSSGALPPKGLIAAPDVSLMQTLNAFHILLLETLNVLLFAEQQVSLPIVPQK